MGGGVGCTLAACVAVALIGGRPRRSWTRPKMFPSTSARSVAGSCSAPRTSRGGGDGPRTSLATWGATSLRVSGPGALSQTARSRSGCLTASSPRAGGSMRRPQVDQRQGRGTVSVSRPRYSFSRRRACLSSAPLAQSRRLHPTAAEATPAMKRGAEPPLRMPSTIKAPPNPVRGIPTTCAIRTRSIQPP